MVKDLFKVTWLITIVIIIITIPVAITHGNYHVPDTI